MYIGIMNTEILFINQEVQALSGKKLFSHCGVLQPDCSSLFVRVLRAVLPVLTYLFSWPL